MVEKVKVAERLQGTIKFFSGRGYGFICPEGEENTGDSGVFFHISNVANRETLEADQPVTYEVVEGREGKGQQAVNIEKVEN